MRTAWQWTSKRISQLLRKVSALSLLLSFLCMGCREDRLVVQDLVLTVTPSPLELPAVYVGKQSTGQLTLQNGSLRTTDLTFDELQHPFSVTGLPTKSVPGDVHISVTFTPDQPGRREQAWTIHAGEHDVVVRVVGTGVAIPACPLPVDCHRMVFDLGLQRCVETPLEDGTACQTENACLLGATCQAGKCLGEARICDDQNACTLNLCNAVSGCEFPPSPPCPGDGKCQLGVCHPATGCGLAPAPEGTVCGPSATCDVADVCIAGECVQRDPPDNFVCAPASPCQAEGRCVGSVCEQPDAVPLRATFTQDTAVTGGQISFPELHDFIVEPTGEMSVFGFFSQPIFRANTSQATMAATSARRCQLWNRRFVCADHPMDVDTGKVSIINPATAQTVWMFDLPTARPDFVEISAPGRIFMARMASLGSDRLAALFEGYPQGTSPETQCRVYFLVMLDSAGTLLYAQRLEDGFLDICNHPHPFGFTADGTGNLYIEFSGSDITAAPLESQSPSLIFSFTRDGLFRWKRSEPHRGGELAVARGLLFPEHGAYAHATSTGDRQFPLISGRALVTSTTVVPSPEGGGNSGTALEGFDVTTGLWQWMTPLPADRVFYSSVIRLAEVKARPEFPPEPTVLAMLQSKSDPEGPAYLWATRASDGASLWSCPVDYLRRGPPSLMEVTRNQLTLMDGTATCGRCDPPFARSRGEFTTFSIPGVNASLSPWPGTFGGPGHEQQEQFSPGGPNMGQ